MEILHILCRESAKTIKILDYCIDLIAINFRHRLVCCKSARPFTEIPTCLMIQTDWYPLTLCNKTFFLPHILNLIYTSDTTLHGVTTSNEGVPKQ